MPVPVLVTLKIRYTNRKAPAQRPFLLAGELASPSGRVLVVLGWLLGRFTCKIWDQELSYYQLSCDPFKFAGRLDQLILTETNL